MRMKKTAKIFPGLLFLFVVLTPGLSAQGHFEFGFHYGNWSIDILRGMIEDGINDALESELKDRILDDLKQDYPTLQEVSYDQDLSFDSGGENYGFEIRWYPGGHSGSFSLGLSVEKTTMRVSIPQVSASLSMEELITSRTADFQGDADGEFLIEPLSFHMSLRWDIMTAWRLHPYITLGFGAATGTALEEGEVSYSYSGDLDIQGEETKHYQDSETKTLKEFKDEYEQEEGEEFFIPGFLPFIQLNLGLKGVLTENLHVLVDAGVWDGFLLRGGVAVRF
ncbi:MAG: hypothetical protein ACLFVG_02145 [Candidatus Aminicenantes bacterium]